MIFGLFIAYQEKNWEMHIRITQVKEEITTKIRKYFELSVNENIVSKLIDDAKDLLRGKFRALDERRLKIKWSKYPKLEKNRTNLTKTE